MSQLGNLDTESAKEVIEILKNVAKNKLVVIVTHNLEQVEKYATRIIKMHDGRIIENNEIKKVEENIRTEESKYNKITILNKYRLGIRNTFNIVSKFLLLFAVFFFIVAAVFLEYSSFELSEKEMSNNKSSMAFQNFSEDRLVIKKEDKTSFSEEDYKKIKEIANVDYIIEDDLLIDRGINLYKNDIYFYGYIRNIKDIDGKLDIGRMPEAENEIVIQVNKEQYYIKNRLDEILNKSFDVQSFNGSSNIEIVTIVGIKYNEDTNNYNPEFYCQESLIKSLRKFINESYSNLKIGFNNKYSMANSQSRSFSIMPSNKVEKGKAIVNDTLKYEVKNGKIKNMPLDLYISNIYYEEELNLIISNTYTKSNFKKVTGYEKYNEYINIVFINDEEYDAIYDKPSYQSSVYIKDVEKMDETIKELESLGIKAKKTTDYTYNYGETEMKVIKIVKVIVTAVLLFVLFFISYFIIRIILKSRNIYYTTLRMLGASYKDVKRILDIELFINSSLAYIGIILIIYLTNINVIEIEYITKLVHYLSIREYALMYVILVVMSRLISRRFSRKLFKNTAINTYNEEV